MILGESRGPGVCRRMPKDWEEGEQIGGWSVACNGSTGNISSHLRNSELSHQGVPCRDQELLISVGQQQLLDYTDGHQSPRSSWFSHHQPVGVFGIKSLEFIRRTQEGNIRVDRVKTLTLTELIYANGSVRNSVG